MLSCACMYLCCILFIGKISPLFAQRQPYLRQNNTNRLKYKVTLCKCQKEGNIPVVDKNIRKVKKKDDMKLAWLSILFFNPIIKLP